MNFDFIISIMFPRCCMGCGILLRKGVLCEPCAAAVSVPRAFFCPQCGSARGSCHPDVFYHLGAAGSYANPVLKALIHSLKFRGRKAAAEPLALLLARYAASSPASLAAFAGHTVVPVPLSRKRLRARGFNQAELIARRFASQLSLPIATRLLARVKHAKPQSETKNLVERKNNIRGCFSVSDPAAAAGKCFILIDDVTTSGATFLEAARALKDAHAARVFALAVAQA